MFRVLFIIIFYCASIGNNAKAQLKGTYEYKVPGIGNTQIVFKPGKQFEYIINHKSGTGSYKKRGEKYYLNFQDLYTNPLANSFYEVVARPETKNDSIALEIRVFEPVTFTPLIASTIFLKDAESDSILFSGAVGLAEYFSVKIPGTLKKIKLNVSYSSGHELNETFNVHQNAAINVYLSCIVFNQVGDGCLTYEEKDKMTLKIRRKDENEIWIRYPQARSRYIKFTKTD